MLNDPIPPVYRDRDVFNRAIDELVGRFVLRALRGSVRVVVDVLSPDPGHVLALAEPPAARLVARRAPTPIASKRARTKGHARRRGKPLLHHRSRRGSRA